MSRKATFAAGCFWGIEETFRQLSGVKSTAVGYMGGDLDDPTYEDVCNDTTGHAEVVQLEYDPETISYPDLLNTFWSCHDPTQLNRQGPDVGTQYRSVVFYHDEEQRIMAEKSKTRLIKSGKYSKEIVTKIILASTFYEAEEYHQKYLQKNGTGSCQL
ncbi:MAG: peptide-methionine (S)-S-oxide reductase MsrA [Deltaproteobacteria bacterium]|jgi:peptide-methionine (S)-S-oxide reductase|nr:peptide-methionine (S)-S-oxide reductase MsrA [Deltaproteobacteria bacterium]